MPLRPVRYSTFGQATLGDIAERAFARAAGGAAIEGNDVRLLCDARENFPAWREALTNAKKYILFEQYIVENDDVGREFSQLLADRARAGVKVYAIVDWLGSWRGLSLWRSVREAGADVRVFNPPRLSSPLTNPSGGSSRGAIPASQSAARRWPRSSRRSPPCSRRRGIRSTRPS